MFKKILILIYLSLIIGHLCADVKSTSGNLSFLVNGIQKMNLSGNGLAIGTESASANFYLSGTLGLTGRTVSSNSNLGSYALVLADASQSGGNIELSLPYAANVSGMTITIKKTSASNKVILKHGGIIEGAYSKIELGSGNKVLPSVQLYSSGNEWYILNQPDEAYVTPVMDASKISNCVLWLDACDASTISKDGSNFVSQWRDKSGRGLIFNSQAGQAMPRYTANWKNGGASIGFTEASSTATMQTLKSTSNLSFSANAITTFVVLDSVTTHTDSNTAYFSINGPSTMTVWNVDRGDLRRFYFNTTHSGGTPAYRSDNFVTYVSNTAYIVTNWYEFKSKTKYIKVGNAGSSTQTAFADAYDYPLQSSSDFSVLGGQKATSNPERTFSGNIGEILIYDRKLANSELLAIETYLKSKWGL